MPFITEEIWIQFKDHHKSDKKSLMICDYPEKIKHSSQIDFFTVEWLKNIVSGIRNIRGELLIKPSTKIPSIFKGNSSKDKENLDKVNLYISHLSGLRNITWAEMDSQEPPSSIFTLDSLKVMIPLEGLIDVKEETQRLSKKITKLTQEKDMLGTKLSNKSFIDNAPLELVENQKERFAVLSTELKNLNAQMSEIKKLI
jgi:valyl-tRNA synthetase